MWIKTEKVTLHVEKTPQPQRCESSPAPRTTTTSWFQAESTLSTTWKITSCRVPLHRHHSTRRPEGRRMRLRQVWMDVFLQSGKNRINRDFFYYYSIINSISGFEPELVLAVMGWGVSDPPLPRPVHYFIRGTHGKNVEKRKSVKTHSPMLGNF